MNRLYNMLYVFCLGLNAALLVDVVSDIMRQGEPMTEVSFHYERSVVPSHIDPHPINGMSVYIGRHHCLETGILPDLLSLLRCRA